MQFIILRELLRNIGRQDDKTIVKLYRILRKKVKALTECKPSSSTDSKDADPDEHDQVEKAEFFIEEPDEDVDDIEYDGLNPNAQYTREDELEYFRLQLERVTSYYESAMPRWILKELQRKPTATPSGDTETTTDILHDMPNDQHH